MMRKQLLTIKQLAEQTRLGPSPSLDVDQSKQAFAGSAVRQRSSPVTQRDDVSGWYWSCRARCLLKLAARSLPGRLDKVMLVPVPGRARWPVCGDGRLPV